MNESLWAPWRMEYIVGKKSKECILCLSEDGQGDRDRLVLYRGALSFVMMNRFPYNNGHLLVAPYKHAGEIEDTDVETGTDMFQLVQRCTQILRATMRPEGFNIGINLGTVAGAGVATHLHIHIVPRWNGDTSFMPVLADIHVIPEHLMATYDKLHPLFNKE